VILAALALVIVAAIVVALRPAPRKVETVRVVCGPLRVTIDAEGKTRVRDRFLVAAPVAGRLARIALQRGDTVQGDAVIARIEPLPLQPLDPRQLAEAKARVAAAGHLHNQANAVVAHARADCELARRELTRAEKLIESGDIARQEFERIRNAEQTCRQQQEAAQYKARAAAAEVEVAKAALLAVAQAGQSGKAAVVMVRAPVGGKVLRVLEESERVVAAGTPLLELSNRGLEIAVDVLSTDAVKIKPGMPVSIEGWGGEHSLPARVRLIEPSAFTKVSALGIEEQRVNVIADFTEPHTPLGDGYRVEARIVVWETNEALKVQLNVLFRAGQNWQMFVVENGLARRRAVETGQRTDFEAEILKGLREGERVIAHPSNQLADGARVSESTASNGVQAK
jgi:HlyD family secretion protein